MEDNCIQPKHVGQDGLSINSGSPFIVATAVLCVPPLVLVTTILVWTFRGIQSRTVRVACVRPFRSSKQCSAVHISVPSGCFRIHN